MKLALTGVTGNMGQEVLREILKLGLFDEIKMLVLEDDKRIKKVLMEHKKYNNLLTVIKGNIADSDAVSKLVSDTDYIVNMCAVIPPTSDKYPLKAIECNQVGVDNLVSIIENMDKQPKLIHISTMALYGNRNSKHIWGQVGDPLLVSPYDIYAATKLRGEFRVLESACNNWVVLRQTAMLHINMLKDNMSDGLMFHTCFNAPLEWVTAHDSGLLIANILKSDIEKTISKDFWFKCYNIGCEKNRITGYDTLNDGLKLIGGSTEDFYKTNYNSIRNFHGMWFYDSHVINDMFNYQTQDMAEYWDMISKKFWYYKFGKIVPKRLLGKLAIDRLNKNPNAPRYWYKHDDMGRINAYMGGKEKYESIEKNWKNFPLLIHNQDEQGNPINYIELQDIRNAKLIDYYFDINKSVEKIDIRDLQSVASAHGGKLLTKKFTKGDMITKLEWETQDGETFEANAYTILKAGHWYNLTYKDNAWDFDRLSKKDKIYAQIWYDSHDENENYKYYYDDNFDAKFDKF